MGLAGRGLKFKSETGAAAVCAQIKLALWLYGLGLVSMLSFSALFNTVGWRTSWSSVLVCLDRAFIFVMIAGTFSPIVAINLQVSALLAACCPCKCCSHVMTCRRLLQGWKYHMAFLTFVWVDAKKSALMHSLCLHFLRCSRSQRCYLICQAGDHCHDRATADSHNRAYCRLASDTTQPLLT